MIAHGSTIELSPEQQEERARKSHLVHGRIAPYVPTMKAINPRLICLDYLQPMTDSPWTRYIRNQGDGSIPLGVIRRLEEISADGLVIDTPFDTPDPWEAIKLIDQIQTAIAPKIVLPNFGDADTWMGRTTHAKALAAICDWHMVEVWVDISNYTLQKLSRRVTAVNKSLENGKTLVLGIYDEGATHRVKANSLITTWTTQVYWGYKISLTEWGYFDSP